MDEITVSRLTIDIGASSSKAVSEIDKLSNALKNLRNSVSGKISGFSKMAEQLREVANAAQGMEDSVGALAKAAQALERLSNLKAISLPKSLGDSIRNIGLAAESVTPESVMTIDSMTRSLQRMANVNLEGFKVLNGFNLPEIPASAGEAITSIAEAAGKVTAEQLQNLESFTASLRGLENVDLSGVLANLREINNQRTRIKVETNDVDRAHKKVGALANILNSIKRIVFYRVIRSAIKAIGEAFSQGAENAYWYSKTMGDSTKYIADAYDSLASKGFTMQNQLGAAWATLKATITPILMEIVRLATMAAQAITQLFAALGGKGNYLKAVDYSKEWAENTARGAGAAKEWKNQLMGFDEINRLEEPSKGGGGGGSALPDYENMFDESPINKTLSSIVDTIKKHLKEIELFALGSLLGIGLILTLTGANVPLGLGLMVAGGIGLAKFATENWDWISSNVGNALSSVEMAASGFSFGVGLILALSGANIPLGLGLMVGGAAALAAGVSLNWNFIEQNVSRVLQTIGFIVGGALLALGAVITFATPGFSAIGLGLMVAGAASLAGAALVNWDYISQKMRGTLGIITTIAGGFLLAIGLVLAMSGVNFPLGFALMAAGGVALGVGIKSVDWDAVKKKLQGSWQGIKDWWNRDVAKYFTLDYWQQKINAINPDYSAIFGPIISACQAAHAWIQDVIDGLFALGRTKPSNWQNNLTQDDYLTGFASGGFPSEGQLFMAREAGPELVGTMGGRTAVANNDQIVSGIREGVFDAVLAAMSQSGGNGDRGEVVVKVYLDSREIKTGQDRLARAWG